MAKRRRPWDVLPVADSWKQMQAAPESVRLRALSAVFKRLTVNPLPRGRAVRKGTKAYGAIDPVQSGQYKNRKIQHIRLEGPWRLNFVVLPRWREVYVCECVQHVRGDDLYTDAHHARLLAVVHEYRPNPRKARPKPAGQNRRG